MALLSNTQNPSSPSNAGTWGQSSQKQNKRPSLKPRNWTVLKKSFYRKLTTFAPDANWKLRNQYHLPSLTMWTHVRNPKNLGLLYICVKSLNQINKSFYQSNKPKKSSLLSLIIQSITVLPHCNPSPQHLAWLFMVTSPSLKASRRNDSAYRRYLIYLHWNQSKPTLSHKTKQPMNFKGSSERFLTT